jgi:hypothetical protein
MPSSPRRSCSSQAERPLVICGAGATRGGAGPALVELCRPLRPARRRQRPRPRPRARGLAAAASTGRWRRSAAQPRRRGAGRRRAPQAAPRLWPAAALCRLGARFIQVDVEAEELGAQPAHRRARRRRRRPFLHAPRRGARRATAFARAPRPGLAARGARPAASPGSRRAPRPTPIPSTRCASAASSCSACRPMPSSSATAPTCRTGCTARCSIRQAPGFLDHYPLGGMGIGTPLAVGAAAAARELAGAGEMPRRVVLVTGDGSFGFYPAELHAAARAGLPLVAVVCNDAAWGTEKHGQQAAIGRTVNTELGALPYEHLGIAFGGTRPPCRAARRARARARRRLRREHGPAWSTCWWIPPPAPRSRPSRTRG